MNELRVKDFFDLDAFETGLRNMLRPVAEAGGRIEPAPDDLLRGSAP